MFEQIPSIQHLICILPLFLIPTFAILLTVFIVFVLRRKWVWSIITLILLVTINFYGEIIALGGLIQVDKTKSDLIVLTYNVHTYSKNYEEKQDAIANKILSASPDIVYLCEFVLSHNRRLDSIMIGNGYIQSYVKSGDCVFYSKYPIDSIVSIQKKGYRKKYSLNNKLRIFMGKDTLTIVGCHLSSSNGHIMKGYRNRRSEADAIYDNIKDEDYPIIVMGDLNDVSGSYAVERIKKAGLKDAWWKGGFGYGATFHDKWLRLRLDHILYQNNKLKLQYVKVIDSDLSDHDALVAGFIINR